MYLEFCSNGMSTTFSNVNSLVETSNFENRRKVNTLNCLFWGKNIMFLGNYNLPTFGLLEI